MKKILIVEDDRIIAGIYRARFVTSGFEVEMAPTVEAAIHLLETFRPDLIQTDLTLPGRTGIELIRHVRSDFYFGKLPIVVLTNGYMTELVDEAWKAGATKVMTKTDCTPKAMLELVESLLEGESPLPNQSAPPKTGPAVSKRGPSPVSTDGDSDFEEDLRNTFREQAPKEAGVLLTLNRNLMKAVEEQAREHALGDLRRKLRTLAGSAGTVGFQTVARLAFALEALLKTMAEDEKAFTPSSRRTVAQGVDRMMVLLGKLNQVAQTESPRILVVDDDVISRKVATYALEKVGLKSLCVEDPFSALKLLASNQVDLVLMDIDMPGMTGFELCRKMRDLPQHTKTPVIYVTALDDFESRAQSTLTGGADLIGKPFPLLELGVKALIHLDHGR